MDSYPRWCAGTRWPRGGKVFVQVRWRAEAVPLNHVTSNYQEFGRCIVEHRELQPPILAVADLIHQRSQHRRLSSESGRH